LKEVAKRPNTRPKKLEAIGNLHIIGVAAVIGDGDVFEENFGDGDVAKKSCCRVEVSFRKRRNATQ
jgi:hypothetical protein